jgi:hypothetical protein
MEGLLLDGSAIPLISGNVRKEQLIIFVRMLFGLNFSEAAD